MICLVDCVKYFVVLYEWTIYFVKFIGSIYSMTRRFCIFCQIFILKRFKTSLNCLQFICCANITSYVHDMYLIVICYKIPLISVMPCETTMYLSESTNLYRSDKFNCLLTSGKKMFSVK